MTNEKATAPDGPSQHAFTPETKNSRTNAPPVDVNGLTLRDAAMYYATVLGWHVFPLRPGTKDAPMTERGQDDATTDPAQVNRWWAATPDANIGIHCRPSGLFVSDLDRKPGIDAVASWEAWKLRHCWAHGSTWHVRTWSGGDHFYYADPEGVGRNTQSRIAPGIDTRGNGYVLAAPSVIDGRPYTALCLAAPVPAHPNLLLETQPVVRPAVERTGPVVLAAAPDVAARVRQLCRQVAEWPDDGRGNEALRDAALKIGGYVKAGQVAEEEAYAALVEAIDGWSYTGGSRATQLGTIGRALRDAHPRPWEAPGGWGAIGSVGLGPFGAGAVAPSSAGPVSPEAFERPAEFGLTLPEEFWAARPVLTHIRQAAHARTVSADVAFYSVLVRLSSLWPETVRLDTGVKAPASANLFAAITGPSGAGKSSGVAVARRLLVRPPWLAEDDYADDAPLGSGEGVAEVFMGTKIVPVRDEGGAVVVDKGGNAKTEKVRAKVRSNALLHADEGEVLNRMLQRSGATIGETLRRAWSGGTIGQSNGQALTTRIIKEGTYSLGMIIGFQRETAEPMLADAAAGTPQRFLWCWAIDPSIPDDSPADPGPIGGVWRASGAPPGEGWAPWLGGGAVAAPDVRPVTYAPEIRTELRTLHLGLSRGAVRLDELDAHMPVTLAKVSALLAALDGRRNVTIEDWQLAGTVWLTSARVRNHLVAYGLSQRGKASAAKRAAYAGDEAAAEAARSEVRDAVEQAAVERVARWLAGKVAVDAGRTPASWRRQLNGRDKPRFDAALSYASAFLWVEVKEDHLFAGTAAPR